MNTLFHTLIGLMGLVSLVFLSGCASSMQQQVKTVTDQYDAIDYSDGIALEEAKTIAQRSLIKQNLVKIYDMENPRQFRDPTELPNHEKHWFITFKEKDYTNIEFIFMVVVEKQTGKVKFANDFSEGREWIIEAALRQ